MAYFVMKNLQLNFEIMNNLKGAYMNKSDREINLMLNNLFVKHMNNFSKELWEKYPNVDGVIEYEFITNLASYNLNGVFVLNQ